MDLKTGTTSYDTFVLKTMTTIDGTNYSALPFECYSVMIMEKDG